MSEAAENLENIGAGQETVDAPVEESRPSIEKFESWEALEDGYRNLES